MILDRIRESRADHLLGIHEALEIANYHYFDRLMRQKPGETLVREKAQPMPEPEPQVTVGILQDL